MLESQRSVTDPELYERLITRLGLALDAARTAVRLRDERPAELELRGLSRAEFELIRAYLDLSGNDASGAATAVAQQKDGVRSAEVIWLKDRAPKLYSARFKSLRIK
ncbi:hypothetical protein [Pseudomonas gingeri]|uniref:Uncharacterized protein n=1 Tax=Pseudomonas gingeri TaxID=117681 RepID=A0A7Y7YED4_9PSED|nr:hypothetical protein [Pseudomonas gingeri]NWA02813.1 hypothetical protein [Pseudomonas gingeri]NWA16976.1 hypothetical protein [Pseudomonas gingeri]NWA58427.1 hypothetical protein [Pseudomonas gingeri]NWA97821.1 hypothetical protein [Pseudomonas gingeri]NWB06095.1 hypothetical protein [Pseudomonas gingeri]